MPPVLRHTVYRRPATAHASPATASGQASTQPADSALAVSPSQRLIKAEAADLIAARQPEPQQWIVLTSWQQVEPSKAKPGRVADYDTETGQQDAAADQPANQRATQVTVTRLILRVYPASALSPMGSATLASKPRVQAAGAHSSSTPKPILDLPAVPFGDGWLVIQL